MALTQAEFSDIVTTSVTDGNYTPDQFSKLLQDKIAQRFGTINNQYSPAGNGDAFKLTWGRDGKIEYNFESAGNQTAYIHGTTLSEELEFDNEKWLFTIMQ